MKLREYLKLARSFNAVLTGVSPVMGAIAMGGNDIFLLALLFLVGFLGHTFGFVLNDIIDYKIDKSSKEIRDRPLVSGTISVHNAWTFALASMIGAFVIAGYIAVSTSNYAPLIVLFISAAFIAFYDAISKKFPFTDIFVALGIFFLVLYGSATVVESLEHITYLAWIVCVLASIQVLFMQIVAGGMKDIENDFKKGAKTAAIKLGVRVIQGNLKVSRRFKTLAYGIQLTDILIVFLPFFILWGIDTPSPINYLQWIFLAVIAILMFFLSHKLLSMKTFQRFKARKYIGSHYMINVALVPVVLMHVNPWAGLLVFFPAFGFVLSNLALHGTLLQPKTM